MEYRKKLYLCTPFEKRGIIYELLGAVVQLVRIPACHAGGRGFASRPHRKNPEA